MNVAARTFFTACLALMLTASVGIASALMRKLDTFVGQPVELLVAVLGAPNEVRGAGPGHEYAWHRRVRFLARSRSSFPPGHFSAEDYWRIGKCTILAKDDQDGIVIDMDYSGARRACTELAVIMMARRFRIEYPDEGDR